MPGITRAQLQDIVAGRITHWNQIPGSPRSDPIAAVDQGPTSGSGRVLPGRVRRRRHPARLAAGDVGDLRAGARLRREQPRGVRLLDLALTETLHVLTFDGVGCTRSTVRSGRYVARRPLGIVTRGRPRGALRKFLRWVRTSRTARRVIATPATSRALSRRLLGPVAVELEVGALARRAAPRACPARRSARGRARRCAPRAGSSTAGGR